MHSGALKTWLLHAATGLLIAWMFGIIAVHLVLNDRYIKKTGPGSQLHAHLMAFFGR